MPESSRIELPLKLLVKASCRTTLPLGVSTIVAIESVLPALVSSWVPRPAKVIPKPPEPEKVTPVPEVKLPYTAAAEEPKANVIVFVVRADMSMVPML